MYGILSPIEFGELYGDEWLEMMEDFSEEVHQEEEDAQHAEDLANDEMDEYLLMQRFED